MIDQDIPDTFSRFGTLEVPRELDLQAIRARGNKRLVRRRLVSGAGIAGASTLAVTATVALAGSHPTDPRDPAVAGSPTATVTTTRVPPYTPPTWSAPQPKQELDNHAIQKWLASWDRQLSERRVPLRAGNSSEADFKQGEVKAYSSVGRGDAAGYLAFIGRVRPSAADRDNPCAIWYFPKNGVGASCERRDDHWVKTYRDSNQGSITMVRFITERADVLVVQSDGFPWYRQSIHDSQHLLPWSGRDGIDVEAPSRHRPIPRLTKQPLTTDQLAAAARLLSATAP